jgi:hypothetical protein
MPGEPRVTLADGADASRRAIGPRIAIQLLSGALRRPSTGCSGQTPARVSSLRHPPLILGPFDYGRREGSQFM